ncbi:MAG: carboxypeptidase regulatory-like domain-containing protein [Thermoplasmata archaeon]|nr:carboxypeptidase regulatory-like domain-containing protein [Thermoplasmata archaeon]
MIGTVVRGIAPYTPISGALVTVQPLEASCPGLCPVAYSAYAGSFSVAASPGLDELTVQDGFYLENYTILPNMTSGQTFPLGVIQLVPDAIVTGVVRGSDPTHEPAAQILVVGSTRDGSKTGVPDALTGSSGAFEIAVPPGASEIDFTPNSPSQNPLYIVNYTASPYLGNTTYIDLAPGATYDLGTVYLPTGVLVTAQLDSSLTHAGIPPNANESTWGWTNASCAAFAPSVCQFQGGHASWSYDGIHYFPVTPLSAIEICSRSSEVCFPEGASQWIGSSVYAWAPPGFDTLYAYADGYVLNATPVNVPSVPLGQLVRLAPVDLVPDGWISITVNVTDLASAPTSLWHTGSYLVEVCSLDGYEMPYSIFNANQGSAWTMNTGTCVEGGCVPVGTTAMIPVAPLRDSIQVLPDDAPTSAGSCWDGLPLRWPIPLDLPVTDNYTWVNATPGQTLDLGNVNLTPGTYVEGQVSATTQNWTVQACSVEAAEICMPASGATDTVQNGSYVDDPSNCPLSATIFCVPAPPGDDTITVSDAETGETQSVAASVPFGSWGATPLLLQDATTAHQSTLAFPTGTITGTVVDASTQLPSTGTPPVVTALPAGASTAGFSVAVTGPAGTYSLVVPPGWYEIQASAPGFEDNLAWVDVNASLVTTAPTIDLTADGVVEGEITGSGGAPLSIAQVSVCPVDESNGAGCVASAGDGYTTTGGEFYALVRSGAGIHAAYYVEASAIGYESNFTWVNVTAPGQLVIAPTVQLEGEIGGGPGPSLAAYVVGRIIGSDTGQGLPDAEVQISPVAGGGPISLDTSIGPSGSFNVTVPTGQYWANFSVLGHYYASTIFLNISGLAPVVDLGTIALDPYGVLYGRVLIQPWSEGVDDAYGLGPGSVEIEVCGAGLLGCAQVGETNAAGEFNVSAPYGPNDTVLAIPTGGLGNSGNYGTSSASGSAPGGFQKNLTAFTSVDPSPEVNFLEVNVTVFGGIRGSVTDEGNGPLRWGTLLAESTPPRAPPSIVSLTLSGSGTFEAFFAAGPTAVEVGGGLFVPYNYAGLTTKAGQVTTLSTPGLTPFGWIEFNVTATAAPFGSSSTQVPFADVSATIPSAPGSLPDSGSAEANVTGYVNVTAPPGFVTVSISAPDFNARTVSDIVVGSGQTTVVAPGTLGSLVPWGWAEGTVTDAATGAPIPDASVKVSAAGNVIGRDGVATASNGLWFLDAPPLGDDNVTASAPGYLVGNTTVTVASGHGAAVSPIALRADGILQGDVTSSLDGVGIGGATVAVCPWTAPLCGNFTSTTNLAGEYAMVAPAGEDVSNVSASGFVSSPSVNVTVGSGDWVDLGPTQLAPYAEVGGIVIEYPSGVPVVGANVSLCAESELPGFADGPCFLTVPSGIGGSFSLSSLPGNYVLQVNDTDLNTTYLPLAVDAGAQINLGSIPIDQYGSLEGTVVDRDTGLPVPGADVLVCPDWVATTCTNPIVVGSDGTFLVSLPAGPYSLQTTADQYQVTYGNAQVVSAQLDDLGSIALVALGAPSQFAVTGTVLASDTGQPLAGASVSEGAESSTVTNASGGFLLQLSWGAQVLTVSATGYLTQSRGIAVTAPLAGLSFVLARSGFRLSGTVSNGLANAPLSGVRLVTGSTLVATSAANGTYSGFLNNGSYAVVVRPNATTSPGLPPFTIVVVIAGEAQTRNFTLFPPAMDFSVALINGASRLPLSAGSVNISGTTVEGTMWSSTVSTGSTGTVTFPIYPGNYTITASVPGYATATSPLQVGGSPVTSVILPLASTGAAAPAASIPWIVVGTAIAAILAVGITAVLVRPPGRSALFASEEEEPEEGETFDSEAPRPGPSFGGAVPPGGDPVEEELGRATGEPTRPDEGL